MGWMETCAVDDRMRFVMAIEGQEEAFAAVCRRFGVSRKTGYKLLGRYREAGVQGLTDWSRAPLNHPQAVAQEIAEHCLAVRRAHPTWGPAKVRAWLERRAAEIAWPAASTIGALFEREGLTVKRRLRRRSPPSSAPFADCEASNDVWCIDFKGWFLTGDGTHCEPLTLSDGHSRYLLRCQAMARTDEAHVWPVVDAALREFGLPLARGGRAVEAVRQGDQGGRRARTNCARQAAAERPAGAAASYFDAGHRQSAGEEPARAAGAPAHVPASLQRRAPAPGARQRHPGRALRCLAAPLRWRVARAELRSRSHRQAGTPQRRDTVAWQRDLPQRSADRRAGRSRRRRARWLESLLRPDCSRRHRAWRRSSAQAKAPGPWTCGEP